MTRGRIGFGLAAALAALAAGPAGAADPDLRTEIGRKPVLLKAQLAGNALVAEVKGGPDGTYHFLVDTGSARTLVSPDLAKALADKDHTPTEPDAVVRSADGRITHLPATLLGRLQLGGARFEEVPALVYDCSSLSDQLGIRIDGVLGFSLFHDAVLVLDYPHSQVVLRSATAAAPSTAGTPEASPLALDASGGVPIVSVKLDGIGLRTLLDSGKDIAMSINRGAVPKDGFAFGPVNGPTVHDLTGDHRQKIGRLKGTLRLGDYAVSRPVAEVSDDLSCLGGGLLKFFTVTFDTPHSQVSFQRTAPEAVAIPSVRTGGLSFQRNAAYWKVAGVIAGSPADKAGITEGDLVTRIAGDPVSAWDRTRYDQLLANGDQVKFTFLLGTTESDKTVQIVELVP